MCYFVPRIIIYIFSVFPLQIERKISPSRTPVGGDTGGAKEGLPEAVSDPALDAVFLQVLVEIF